jgi:nucleoside-diphosphate-sugar epimerase
MRVFVAGATGVLGQPTVKGLVASGHEVRGAARWPLCRMGLAVSGPTCPRSLLRNATRAARPVETKSYNLWLM